MSVWRDDGALHPVRATIGQSLGETRELCQNSQSSRAVKRWETSAVVHVEHEQQNNSKTSEQQQANVKDFG